MSEIIIYKSRRASIKLMLLASPFVYGGFWGLHSGNMSTFMCWFGICFFGLAYPLGLFNLFDRRPQVIINKLGIFAKGLHDSVINWSIIRDAYLVEISGQVFISLAIDDELAFAKKGEVVQKSCKVQ